ncbi:TetR/AcrR family transcriptional regulator [Streptomyces yaizuensis]|uniref:TetR/AcrR family transcriptional regulator C-terminal domain-containing protein n=1 Tax=Streptomyces yaizuensis TaxID=2989713 RepID=A0ABQ5P3Q8_9ACTN|nr:TetR/AcrR family transcriptional regulator [Streptomyces sp. YSPA8]GLF97233.1 TetR/AcrR family transcriptional regulator C-terminal domain-containing protein [Streptomyces sp. YSPA8]
MTTETSGSGDLDRTLGLLWGTADRPTRGPKPALALNRIVATAVAVADAEGIGAVSMRRIATELGTGTMSLYRYVPGKAELLDLMLNHVSDPDLAPTADDGGAGGQGGEGCVWRSTVDAMARGHLQLYRAHPWLLKISQARAVLGPSSLRALETALSGLRSTGLRDPELISVVIMVQGFVTGIARTEIEAAEAREATGQSEEEFWAQQAPYLERAMRSGEYPVSATLSEETFSRDFDHFEFGLKRIVDGIAVLIEERAEERDKGRGGERGGGA